MTVHQAEKVDLQVALVQIRPEFGQVDANLAAIEDLLESTNGVDLIVLPEMFNTGFSMDSRANSESLDGPTSKWMLELAREKQAVVCGSISIGVAQDDYRNRLLWVSPCGKVDFYDKRHLFRMAGEDKRFTPGERQLVVELKGWRIRPLVCYDLRFPVWSRDARDTDLLLYVACWPQVRAYAWSSLLTARAIENQCYVVGVNRVGKDHNGHMHSGDSQALDFMGQPLLHVRNQETVAVTRLSATALDKFKQQFPAYLDADDFAINV